MAKFTTEAKVGVFVLAGLALLAYMSIRLGNVTIGGPESYQIWAVFDHATGLKKKTPVMMAGIQIGEVEGVSLYKGRAKVMMRIMEGVEIAADSVAYIRTQGVLGDKYVALEEGSPGAPKMADGGQLAKARVPADVDNVITEIGSVAQNLKDITESLKVSLASPQAQENLSQSLANIREISGALKETLASPQGREDLRLTMENIRELTGTLSRVVEANEARMGVIMANLEKFSKDVSGLTDVNKAALSETVENFRLASRQLEGTMGSLKSLLTKLDRGEGSLGELINDDTTVAKLNSTLESLDQVTSKINRGEGTIGRLVNDDATVTKIDEALTGINDFLGRADDWRMYVDFKSEYMFDAKDWRSEFNVRIQPRADKFYLIGVVTDYLGKRSETEVVTDTSEGGTTERRTVTQVKYDKDDLLFNAQFGKRFRNLTLRAGVFQSTAGVGLDYDLWKDHLGLTLEAFDFTSEDNPRLKAGMDLRFLRYFYLTSGVDNFLNEEPQFFLGGGITFFDDDLRFLMTSLPSF